MDFGRRAVTYGLLAVVYFAAVFFGGAHVWSQSILILFIGVACSTGLLIRAVGLRGGESLRIVADPLSLAGILFLAWTAFQLVPLPPETLRILSPNTLALWETTDIAGGTPPFPLSLYPYVTERSLVFAAALLLFYWWALYGITERRQMKAVVMGLIVIGSIEAFYGMTRFVTGMPYVLWWEQTFSEKVATGTFINRNHFAGFLAMLICLTVGNIWAATRETRPHRKRRRLFDRFTSWTGSLGTRGHVLVLCVVLMTAALLTSASRGGVLSLLGGLLFMFGLIIVRFLKTGKAAVFVVAVLCGFIYTGYIASERVLERFRSFSGGFEGRLALARATAGMGGDFPNTGTGLGTFEFTFPRYQAMEVNRLVDYAHNDWVQLFAESGWPGVLIVGGGFLWFMAACINRWRRRHDPFSVGIGLGGMGAFVAIALHSLSEFNLHMPANALLLTLIAALTLHALHSGQHEEVEHAHRAPSFAVPRWTVFVLALVVIGTAGTTAVWVLKSWRADWLARTVWNSTIPAAVPTDEELVTAWKLAPGNATYWNLMAARIVNRVTPALKKAIAPGETDADIRFLKEGVRRNPTSWISWRNLGWSAFLKCVADPGRYVPLVRYAFERARSLRPYAASGHFEYGMTGLLAESLLPGKGGFAWKEAFRTALALDPGLAASVADQLTLYHGVKGAKILRELLPEDPVGYRRAADYLIGQGFADAGLDLLREEQEKREKEAAALWREYRGQQGRTSGIPIDIVEDAKENPLLKHLIATDPRHPGSLLAQGKVLDALKTQERKGGRFSELGDPAEIAANLSGMEQKRGAPGDTEYFLGRIAEERGDQAGATERYRKALSLNPNHFPALLRLQALIAGGGTAGAHLPNEERLAERVRFYEMAEIRPDAWRWSGLDGGWPSWTAPFRIARGTKGIAIRFSGDGTAVSKLILDGRLLDGWDESRRNERKSIALPPGEHVLRISQYRPYVTTLAKILPFELQIEFIFN